MKRLAVYFSVLIGCLFIGLTTYYMVKNYEIIDVKAGDSNLDAIYLNVGEETTLEITHQMKKTELGFTFSTNDIVSFDLESGKLVGLNGGETKLTITTENEKYGPFEFTIKVGSGEEGSPYYIKSEEDLIAIGKTRTYGENNSAIWSESGHYEIVSDIVLKEEWTPLCLDNSFTGTLQGNSNKIYNLLITSSQETAGLFATVGELATIDSIVFVDPKIIGQFDFAGIVAGASFASTISRIEVVNGLIKVAPYLLGEDRDYTCMAGGIVGASLGVFVGNDGNTALVEKGIVSMCSFQGTIGTIEQTSSIIALADLSLFSIGGISGYVLGSTIHNTKAEVSFEIGSELASLSAGFNREQAVLTGVCIDIGGIVGSIDSKNEITSESRVVGTIYPMIKNNLAIISVNNKTTSTRGIIGHVPLNVQYVESFDGTPAAQRVIGNYYYSFNNSITEGGSTHLYATTQILSEAALKNKATYTTMPGESWDIGNVISAWVIDENQAPKINVLGMETPVYFDQDTFEIASAEDFYNYYTKMTSSSVSDIIKRYWLRQNYVLKTDINLSQVSQITSFVPIGGGKFAFNGTFDGNGKSIIFSETAFSGSEENLLNFAGAFGQIASGAEVKNLIVTGINISNAVYAGGVAGINYGKITNCIVKDITIANAKYSGGIVGVNYGVVSSNIPDIIADEENRTPVSNIDVTDMMFINSISVNNLNDKVFAGSITGINLGTITGIKITGTFKITGETSNSASSTKIFGGLVGYNSGILQESYILNLNLYDYSTGKLYLGALAGINSGTIHRCSAGGAAGEVTANIFASFEAGNQIAGGFAGMISETGVVSQSFANVNIECRTAAGFAPYLFGNVSESYNLGVIKGEEVGGFAVHMALSENSKTGGKVSDCYTLLNLNGQSESSKIAGLSVYMRHPAIIEKCFVSCTFGIGNAYYESVTNTREGFVNWVTSWAQPRQKLGTITKVVINTTPSGETENNKVNKTKAIISYNNQDVRYMNSNECKTSKSVYENMGFNISSSTGWTIEEGSYPILTSIEGLNGFSQIQESSVGQ